MTSMAPSTRLWVALVVFSSGLFGKGTVFINGILIKEMIEFEEVSHNWGVNRFVDALDKDNSVHRKLGSSFPTDSPAPSPSPSSSPSLKPTHSRRPTILPSQGPTDSFKPSPNPSASPSLMPSSPPSRQPSTKPSSSPTHMPSQSPSEKPSQFPTKYPTSIPSVSPTTSSVPSLSPTLSSPPSQHPSSKPSTTPSTLPSASPTSYPSIKPSIAPSTLPSASPTSYPSIKPSIAPSTLPSASPTSYPSKAPSGQPSLTPTASPSLLPSYAPSIFPTDIPTVTASLAPSGLHTIRMSTALSIVLAPLSTLLEGKTIRIFEEQTMQFIQTTMPPLANATVAILVVTVTNQTLVGRRRELSQPNHLNRRRQLSSSGSLRVQFVVIGEFVFGNPPVGFNFAQYVDDGFLHHYNDFIYRLSSVDPTFTPLLGTSHATNITSQGIGSKTVVSATGIGLIVGGSIAALTMACLASVYAIRRRRPKGMRPMLEHGNDTFVEEVEPSRSDTPNGEYARNYDHDSHHSSRDSPLSHSSGSYTSHSYETHTEGSADLEPASPSTMETGTRSQRSATTIDSFRSATTEEIYHLDNAIEFSLEKLEQHREEFGEHIGDIDEVYRDEMEIEETPKEAILRFTSRTPRGMSGRLLDTDSDEDPMHSNPRGHQNVVRPRSHQNVVARPPPNHHQNVARPPPNHQHVARPPDCQHVQRPPDRHRGGRHAEVMEDEEFEQYHKYFENGKFDAFNNDEYDEPEDYDADDDIHQSRSIDPPEDNVEPVQLQPPTNVGPDPFARKASDPFHPSRESMKSLMDDNTTIGDTTLGESVGTSGRESVGSEGDSIGLKLTDEILASFNVQPPKEDSPKKLIPRMSHSRFPELYAHTEDPYEELLDDSTPTSSAFSAIETSEAMTAEATMGGTLGARPISKAERAQYYETNSYRGRHQVVVLRRSGLYDVFAPPGPIGMVVDTTRDGPVVHSLKSTSPLIGLIYPGDVIVGLDDTDTRSMTAATLTRLMAKRSQQSERKITLLAVD